MSKRERLIEQLGFDPASEALEALPGELDDLTATAALLQRAAALEDGRFPGPDSAETAGLAAALAAAMPESDGALARELTAAWSETGGWAARVLGAVRPQVRLLGRRFWLASAAVVGAGLPLLSPDVRAWAGLDLTYGAFLVVVAPLLSAMGVAYAFRSAGTGMAEVELTCALTPAQLVLGRLFWVAGYDLLLLGAASLASLGLEPGMQLGWLVLGWLAPMLLLSCGVLVLSLWMPPWAGAAAGLSLWAGALGVALANRPLSALTWAPLVLPMAVGCGIGALLLAAALAAVAPRLTARLAGLVSGEAM